MRTYFDIRQSRSIVGLMSLGLVVAGCSMFSGEASLHNNAKGSIYLKEIADWSFEASHPATIDPATMLRVVKGVVVDDAMTMKSTCPPVAASR
jgi:hypothetical protein